MDDKYALRETDDVDMLDLLLLIAAGLIGFVLGLTVGILGF